MLQDTQIESCNKKLKEATDKVSKTHNCVLNTQHPPGVSRQADSQHRLELVARAKNTEQKALAKLSEVMIVSSSLLQTGSGKVAIELPATVYSENEI
jgi:predicted glutamine amidotransferase